MTLFVKVLNKFAITNLKFEIKKGLSFLTAPFVQTVSLTIIMKLHFSFRVL